MTQTPPKPQDFTAPSLSPEVLSPSPSPVPLEASPPTGLKKWFYDLPIRTKQLLGLLSSEAISIIGLVGVGSLLLFNNGRAQLVNQAESELVVTGINYNIKIDQMGFGFRGQSDNAAIIQAARLHNQRQPLDPDLEQQVKSILINEIKARQIEFATLVGANRRIIVNANQNRSGQEFDPNQLVSRVLANPEQIKTSEIISWSELSKENPPLPVGVNQEDALIRYTATPVKDPSSGKVIGVLISGDIVDGKIPIVERTVTAFEGGYSAIYHLNSQGELELATSKNLPPGTLDAIPDVPLEDKQILQAAIAQPEQVVTGRGRVAGEYYTLAAKAITNSAGQPIGVMVRGTPETFLNKLLKESIGLQLGVAGLAIIFDILLALALSRIIAGRIEKLRQTTLRFTQGDRTVRPSVTGKDEIGQLAATFREMADGILENQEKIAQETEQSQIIKELVSNDSAEFKQVNPVIIKTLEKTRNFFGFHRLLIYTINPDGSGYVSHEAVANGISTALTVVHDECIPPLILEDYRQGRVVPTPDVFETNWHPDHMNLMKRLAIRANLVVPIVSQNKLFGLMIAHDCHSRHQWQNDEIDFLKQLASQLGLTLDRIALLKQQAQEANRAEKLKNITLKIASNIEQSGIFDTATYEIRTALNLDRVIIYRFDETWAGTVTHESVAEPWPMSIGAMIADPCFAERYVEKYRQGRVQATADIYKADLTDCHIKQLEPFAVKANLVAPILVKDHLMGLLIGHQCSGPRNWEQGDIDFFNQLATQIGLAIERAQLIENQRQAEIEQRAAKEQLQQRALQLLMDVYPVSEGDLTIRAQVTADEIGTIADSYNAMIENLRKIVSRVQTAATQVVGTTSVNEQELQKLSQAAEIQAKRLQESLDRLQAMTASIQMVAVNAEEAEAAVMEASENVEAGEAAMNRTVEGMFSIRESVAETAAKIKSLGDASDRISKVVNLIGRFAAQTHLLALKASIEAARAGEEGRGFAVIADEVRSLAAQSAEATADIELLVGEIQAKTKEVVKVMETGQEQVVMGANLVEETRASLSQITAASAKINELVIDIAKTAVEQSEGSTAITKAMAEVAKIASDTSLAANNSVASFQELLQLAQELQSDTAQFKV